MVFGGWKGRGDFDFFIDRNGGFIFFIGFWYWEIGFVHSFNVKLGF